MINIQETSQITKIYLVENCYGDPNKVYIGKTKTNTRIFRHIKTYGNNIIFTYIDEIESLDSKDWKPLECFWIEYFRQLGFDIQNKNNGGGGASFYTQESKDKMSQKRYSQEIKDKMSLATKGKPKPIGFGDKISKALKGREISLETRNKMSKANKGKIISKETKDKMSKSKNKPIIQYNKKGIFIKEWSSVTEASTKLNINQPNISMILCGRGKTYKGFIWKYKP